MKHLTIVRWGTLRLLALVLSLMVTGLGMIPGLDGPGSGGAAHAQSATMPAASADGGLQGVRLAHSSMTSSAGRDPAQALCPLEDSAWRMGRLALEAPISWRVEEAATAARIEPGSLDGGSQLLLAQTQAPLKCDRSAACRTVGALLKLISSQNGGPDPGAFARFTQKFDPAFGRLWHKELACRFDTVPQFAGTTPLLGRIHRDRMGLKTLNARASFPGSTLCAYKAMSQEKHPVLPRPGEKEGCEDVEAIQRISTNLEQLGSMLKCTSAEEARSGVEPRLCPETTVLEHIKQRADEAGRVTKVLARVAADKAERDADLRTALETTQDGFEKVSSGLGRAIKIAKTCEEIRTFVNALREFKRAVDEINAAGCDSRKLAQGFDQLFRSAGIIGKKIAKPLPALKPVFEILAQNENFFVKVSGALNPEQRWARQFQGVDGYVPGCSTALKSGSR